jgi:hypothetical protein
VGVVRSGTHTAKGPKSSMAGRRGPVCNWVRTFGGSRVAGQVGGKHDCFIKELLGVCPVIGRTASCQPNLQVGLSFVDKMTYDFSLSRADHYHRSHELYQLFGLSYVREDASLLGELIIF